MEPDVQRRGAAHLAGAIERLCGFWLAAGGNQGTAAAGLQQPVVGSRGQKAVEVPSSPKGIVVLLGISARLSCQPASSAGDSRARSAVPSRD